MPKTMILKFVLFIFFFFPLSVETGEIKINVSNITEQEGLIHFALYDNPKFFPKNEGKMFGIKEEAKKIFMNGIIIKNLEQARYAVAVYHDKNANNKFDKFLSVPKEKYGFSNDASVFLGPPDFEEAAFFLGEDDFVEINIRLR